MTGDFECWPTVPFSSHVLFLPVEKQIDMALFNNIKIYFLLTFSCKKNLDNFNFQTKKVSKSDNF